MYDTMSGGALFSSSCLRFLFLLLLESMPWFGVYFSFVPHCMANIPSTSCFIFNVIFRISASLHHLD
jgi:hypothetical protein